MVLGVLGVEGGECLWGLVWRLWREKWLYLWITANAWEGLQCCGGGVEGSGRRWSACEGLWGVVGSYGGLYERVLQ